MRESKLILIVALFFVGFDNIAFFENLLNIYSLNLKNILFLFSIIAVLISFITLFFTLFSSKYTTKPLLITTLIISSFTSYFMNNYNVVIDTGMIQNILETNFNESIDLFNFKLILYFIFLGVLPSIFVYRIKLTYEPILKKIKFITVLILVIVVILFAFSRFYTSFFREHKPLRYYVNPIYYIYSINKYISNSFKPKVNKLEKIGNDANIEEIEKKELIILVVGEASRADRFSINGYDRETNPLLKQEDIINFSNMYSCGTSTAVSVPCMFSSLGQSKYSDTKAKNMENILDILNKTGKVNTLWRDNNSDSKGVALRVSYEDFKDRTNNPICDVECRDEGMLYNLDSYIKSHSDKDILIVLHQMGCHGPAYYKRYPKEFEKFTPICETNQLEECTQEEISNTYDNIILYTDYFLSKVINLLKLYSNQYETGVIYISDHGESLGENGIYLHGLPYFMAPKEQIHIASFMWFGDEIKNELNITKLKTDASNNIYSQDNLFHTLLGIFEVNTTIYNQNMDILYDSRK